jgi:hypothetical protein
VDDLARLETRIGDAVEEPLTRAEQPEHVASHHVGAAWAQRLVACAGVGVLQRLVEMPVMQLDTATAERVLEALRGYAEIIQSRRDLRDMTS